jgi:hypothetical protein
MVDGQGKDGGRLATASLAFHWHRMDQQVRKPFLPHMAGDLFPGENPWEKRDSGQGEKIADTTQMEEVW